MLHRDLIKAIHSRDTSSVQEIIKKITSKELVQDHKKKCIALNMMVTIGINGLIQPLIDKLPRLHKRKYLTHALATSIETANLEALKIILHPTNYYSNILKSKNLRKNPLYIACQNGDIAMASVISALLSVEGGRIFFSNSHELRDKFTPFYAARHHPNLGRYLLENGHKSCAIDNRRYNHTLEGAINTSSLVNIISKKRVTLPFNRDTPIEFDLLSKMLVKHVKYFIIKEAPSLNSEPLGEFFSAVINFSGLIESIRSTALIYSNMSVIQCIDHIDKPLDNLKTGAKKIICLSEKFVKLERKIKLAKLSKEPDKNHSEALKVFEKEFIESDYPTLVAICTTKLKISRFLGCVEFEHNTHQLAKRFFASNFCLALGIARVPTWSESKIYLPPEVLEMIGQHLISDLAISIKYTQAICKLERYPLA